MRSVDLTLKMPGLGRFGLEMRRVRLSIELLLGRRLLVYALIDVFLLFSTLISSLIAGQTPNQMYVSIFLVPLFVVALPALSDSLALERRAGSLDLALTSPAGRAYFYRRIGSLTLVVALQGTAILLLCWFTMAWQFPILYVILQIALLSLVIGETVLFWALRLRTAGAVWIAATATILALGKWTFYRPMPDPLFEGSGWWVLSARPTFEFAKCGAVLVVVSLILHLYSRRRLDRPETLLT